MATFRIETVLDPITRFYYNELYYPSDAVEPLARTEPVYKTMDEAEADAIEMFKKTFPDQPISKKD